MARRHLRGEPILQREPERVDLGTSDLEATSVAAPGQHGRVRDAVTTPA